MSLHKSATPLNNEGQIRRLSDTLWSDSMYCNTTIDWAQTFEIITNNCLSRCIRKKTCRYADDAEGTNKKYSEAEFLNVIGTKVCKSFPPCYSQSPLLTDDTPPPSPPSKSGLNHVCYVNIVYDNLKSENSQDYANEIVHSWIRLLEIKSVTSEILYLFICWHISFDSVSSSRDVRSEMITKNVTFCKHPHSNTGSFEKDSVLRALKRKDTLSKVIKPTSNWKLSD